MENCYALLEINPTAGTEEIEESYQRKKREFGTDASKQQELDNAYNEAIMATFAPIRAFASPLPPLTTGKKILPTTVVTDDNPSVSSSSPPAAKPAPPVTTPSSSGTRPPLRSTDTVPYTDVSDGASSVPFTDTELMNMDVSKLREGYISHAQDENHEAEFVFLGIENKLLRYYVKTYIALVVFDMAMRLLIGPGWLALTETAGTNQIPPTPVLLSILFSFVSIVYCFVCALPMPFTARFFLLGQPPDKNSIMWGLFFLGVVSAFLLRWLTGRFLPLNVAGSVASFMLTSMAVSIGTLRHNKN